MMMYRPNDTTAAGLHLICVQMYQAVNQPNFLSLPFVLMLMFVFKILWQEQNYFLKTCSLDFMTEIQEYSIKFF